MLLYFMDFSTIFSPRLWNFPLFKRCTALTNVSNTINYHYQKGLRLWKAKECALNVCGKTFWLLITSSNWPAFNKVVKINMTHHYMNTSSGLKWIEKKRRDEKVETQSKMHRLASVVAYLNQCIYKLLKSK